MRPVAVPYVSISPSRITTFWRMEPKRFKHKEESKDLFPDDSKKVNDNKPPKFKGHTGLISKKAGKRINNAIDWLLLLAQNKTVYNTNTNKKFKFKISFVTLTLSSKQIHSDNVIKKELLNHFLVEARKKWQVDKYVWRAEKQMNGNIHFHIVVDKFINYKDLLKTWNRIQNKLGYIDRYSESQKKFFKNGFRYRKNLSKSWSYANQRKAYYLGKACGFTNPNSTDIHKVFGIKNIAAYLSKYCTKNPPLKIAAPVRVPESYNLVGDPNVAFLSLKPITVFKVALVSGKSWGLSQSLSKMKNLLLERDSFVQAELDVIEEKYHKQIFVGEHFVTLKIHFSQWKEILFGHLRELFVSYLEQARSNLEAENLKICFNL